MYIRTTLLLAFISFSLSSVAQNFQPAFKLYANLQYVSSDPLPPLIGLPTSAFRLKGITPAVQWFSEEKWAYHEVELSNFRIRNSQAQLSDTKEFLIGGRYEYGRVLDLNYDEDLLFFLGASARFFFYDRLETPNVSTRVEERRSDTKVVLGVVPRAQYRLNERFSIDLNIVVSALSIGWERRYVDNPLLSVASRSRTNFSTDFHLLSNITTRLGVIYHL
ncbi:MAG: hypothetical protein AAGI23_17815 [Bacteroidota bacterium]